jgi:hypothetical protein
MKIAPLLCALWACASLALEAGAAESSGHGGSSQAVTDMDQGADRAAPDRDTSSKGAHAQTRQPTRVGSGKVVGSRGEEPVRPVAPRGGSATPKRVIGQPPRSDADRLHTLLNAKARGRIANSAPRVGSSHAAIDYRGVGGLRSAGTPGATTMRVAMSPSRTASNVNAAPKGSMIGGPRASSAARLGGPSTAWTQNRAAIDGANLHRKP